MHDFDIFGYQYDDTLYTVLTRGYIGRFLMLTVISEVERAEERRCFVIDPWKVKTKGEVKNGPALKMEAIWINYENFI